MQTGADPHSQKGIGPVIAANGGAGLLGQEDLGGCRMGTVVTVRYCIRVVSNGYTRVGYGWQLECPFILIIDTVI